MTALTIALLLLAPIIVFSAVKVVPQGWECTVDRLGRFHRVLKPGLHLIVPFIDHAGRSVPMTEQMLDIPLENLITKDNVMMTADAVAFYRIVDTPKAVYEVENLTAGIRSLVLTNTRTAIGSMNFDEVLSEREEINSRVIRVVDDATSRWGTKVIRIEVKELAPRRR